MIENEMDKMYRPGTVALAIAALVMGTGCLALFLISRVLL